MYRQAVLLFCLCALPAVQASYSPQITQIQQIQTRPRQCGDRAHPRH